MTKRPAHGKAAVIRAVKKYGKAGVGPFAWVNWYISRGRLPYNPTPSDLRRVSWRRPF